MEPCDNAAAPARSSASRRTATGSRAGPELGGGLREVLGPASDAIHAGLGAPLPEWAPREWGMPQVNAVGRRVAKHSVPAHTYLGGQVSGRPASDFQPYQLGSVRKASCRWLGSPLSHRCEGTWDLNLRLPPHQTMPASPANVLMCGGSFLGPFRHGWPKEYIIIYLKWTGPNERAPVQQWSEAGLDSITYALA